MHFSGLIIGPDPMAQLARYDENLEVDPYPAECWECEGLTKYQPCAECNDTGKLLSTRNPDGEWDYVRVGGRYRGRLYLKPGATGGALAERSWEWDHAEDEPSWIGRADVALAGAVDWSRTIAEMGDYRTYFLVAEGVWRSNERSDDGLPAEDYVSFWDRLVSNLPPDTLVTLVDAHS